MNQKEKYREQLQQCNMIGWMREIEKELVEKIKATASIIRNNYDCMVVIGIGGSFLGSYAFHKMFQHYFDDKSFENILGLFLTDSINSLSSIK